MQKKKLTNSHYLGISNKDKFSNLLEKNLPVECLDYFFNDHVIYYTCFYLYKGVF